jgi:hypothetical protein
MKKVYIETTLFNFYFAEGRNQYYGKTIKYCQDTKLFFDAVRAGKFEPYTSEYVIEEIEREENEKHRIEMLKLIADCDITILPRDERVERLAGQYIAASAIPGAFQNDALHIAFTVIHGLDFIVSLNFQHIVKDKAIKITAKVNEAEGHRNVGIYEPGKVIDDENN